MTPAPLEGLDRYWSEGEMFYFFQRGAEFLQCEIRGDDSSGYEIVITEPKRPERRESFPTSDEAYKRWVELQDTLVVRRLVGPARPGLRPARRAARLARRTCRLERRSRDSGRTPWCRFSTLKTCVFIRIQQALPDSSAKRLDLEHSDADAR